MTELVKVRRFTQARGRERRQLLLQAARELLAERDMDDISLTLVAEQAKIPASSTYHFFADMRDLYKDLSRTIALEMVATPPPLGGFNDWEDIVQQYLAFCAAYFNLNGAARQLMIGPKTTPDIKEAGCGEDYRFGKALRDLVQTYYVLPDFIDSSSIFYRAIKISDVMFSISVAEFGQITDLYLREAINAMVAYLKIYLPKMLPAQI